MSETRAGAQGSPERRLDRLGPGDHLCCLYLSDQERAEVLSAFFRQGLARNEQVLYLAAAGVAGRVLDSVREWGLTARPHRESGRLRVLDPQAAYLPQGSFDPLRMLELLRRETENALAEGRAGLRVAGEMDWVLRGLPGSERLLEYECRLNDFLPGSRCLALCLYDRRLLPADLLLRVLRAHPAILIGPRLFDNPRYLPPDRLLGTDLAEAELDDLLRSLIDREEMQHLRSSQVELTALMEHVPLVMLLLDEDRRIRLVNRCLVRVAGHPAEELIGMRGGEAIGCLHALDDSRGCGFGPACGQCALRRLVLDTFATRVASQDREIRITAVTDRGPREKTLMVFTLPLELGGRSMVLVGIDDVTERRRMETELRANEERFRALATESPVGIYTTDVRGDCLYVNPRWCEMAGMRPEEALGEGWLRAIHPDDRQGIARAWEGMVRQRGPWRLEYRFQTPQGRTTWVFGHAAGMLGADGGVLGYVGTNTDITDRKAAEDEVRRHNERLEEIVDLRTSQVRQMEHERAEHEKLAAAGRMAARIAHEVNNPLAGIKNAFLLIRDAVPEDHPHHPYLHRIEVEIERIRRIIGQMFELYRPELEERRPCRVAEVVADVVALLEVECRDRQVRLHVEGCEAGTPVRLREGMLRQVLYNLLQNALDASETGGRIQVGARVREGRLTLTVTDQGSGIREEVRPHIFEPFFTTKDGRQRKSLGLGLSITKSLIEMQGGTIEFENGPPQGTVFRVTLPASEDGANAEAGKEDRG